MIDRAFASARHSAHRCGRPVATRIARWLGGWVVIGAVGFADAAAAADTVAPAAALTPAAAINIAGRERMLSQRLAKAYLMVGQGIQPERGRKILGESIELFEKQLAQLNGLVPNDDVRRALAVLERGWKEYRPLLVAPPSIPGAREVYGVNETVLEAAHRLTLAYEKASGRPVDRLVNIAGRQRMLSQRMAKYYLFWSWDVNGAAAQMELNMARAEFSSGMRQLYVAPMQDEQITAVLDRLDREWRPYHAALSASRDVAALKSGAPEIIDMSERILDTIERLVALYERQVERSSR